MVDAGTDWIWLAVGCMLFGLASGTTLRFLPFVVIAAVAVVLLVGIGAPSGHAVAAAIITIVGLQIGYGCGVIARVGVRTRLRRRGTSALRSRSRR